MVSKFRNQNRRCFTYSSLGKKEDPHPLLASNGVSSELSAGIAVLGYGHVD
jgi:hypothetical protein